MRLDRIPVLGVALWVVRDNSALIHFACDEGVVI